MKMTLSDADQEYMAQAIDAVLVALDEIGGCPDKRPGEGPAIYYPALTAMALATTIGGIIAMDEDGVPAARIGPLVKYLGKIIVERAQALRAKGLGARSV
jgi:hypothetical protein